MNEIYEIKHYADKDGRRVEKLVPIEGGLIEWFGKCSVTIPNGGTFDVMFQFPATTVTETTCFETFDENLSKRLSEMAKIAIEEEEKKSKETPKVEETPQIPENNVVKADFKPKSE